jgi:hypothetical protein
MGMDGHIARAPLALLALPLAIGCIEFPDEATPESDGGDPADSASAADARATDGGSSITDAARPDAAADAAEDSPVDAAAPPPDAAPVPPDAAPDMGPPGCEPVPWNRDQALWVLTDDGLTIYSTGALAGGSQPDRLPIAQTVATPPLGPSFFRLEVLPDGMRGVALGRDAFDAERGNVVYPVDAQRGAWEDGDAETVPLDGVPLFDGPLSLSTHDIAVLHGGAEVAVLYGEDHDATIVRVRLDDALRRDFDPATEGVQGLRLENAGALLATPRGRLFAAADGDFIDLSAAPEVAPAVFRTYQPPLSAVATTPDGQTIVAASRLTLHLWPLDAGPDDERGVDLSAAVNDPSARIVALTVGESHLYAVVQGGTAEVGQAYLVEVDIETLTPATSVVPGGHADRLALSPDGEYVFVARAGDPSVHVFQRAHTDPIGPPIAVASPVRDLAVRENAQRERCDGADEDCDGVVDEGPDGPGDCLP